METPTSVRTERSPLGVLGLLALCTMAGMGGLAVLSSCIVIRGRTGDQIRFPLAPHADVLVDCVSCHDDVAGDDITSETRRSLERACMECHQEEADDCSYCHTDVASAGEFPEKERHLSFSHRTHLERVFGDCSECHDAPHADPGDALAEEHPTALPGHDECFSCHEMQEFNDRLECRNCHEALFEYGLKPFERFSHGEGWLDWEHSQFARDPKGAATCAQCHDQSFCDDCHAGTPRMRLWERRPEQVGRAFLHPGDYVSRHMWDLRADPAACARCHSTNWCQDCHDSRGVTERTAGLRAGGFDFHGPGVLVPGSPDFHGTAARRDIMSCAACHSQGASGSCVTCHTVGAFGGNPHPPGFDSRLNRTGASVCRLCHVP